jgi:hypothetical protein
MLRGDVDLAELGQGSTLLPRAPSPPGSAESFTLTATRLPEGKFSVKSGTSQIEAVTLTDQVLELRMRGELIHCLRKLKMTDAYSHRPLGGHA